MYTGMDVDMGESYFASDAPTPDLSPPPLPPFTLTSDG